MTIELNVTNMTCGGCETSVKKIISRHFEIDITNVDASHNDDRVLIHESVENLESVFELLNDAGFPTTQK